MIRSNNPLLFTLLLLFFAGAMAAQRSATPTTKPAASVPQYVPTAGDHVAGEAILYFKTPRTAVQQQAIERKLYKLEGATIKEWSVSGKYALVKTNAAYYECQFDGNGNPYGVSEGFGDGYGLNYNVGTNQWEDKQTEEYCLPVNFDPATRLFTVDYASYSPTIHCSDIDRLTPTWTNPYRTRPKVAIIDSGIRGLGGIGYINEVRVNQKVIPDGCSATSCSYYIPSQDESYGFNSHGRFITTLISGWFRANELHSRLTINSYKVLDEKLKCNVFQVVKAIERATADRNHIISLSLGFIPHGCTDTTDPVDGIFAKSGHQRSILYDAIKAAQDRGIVIITSAGNDGNNLDDYPQYPAAETGLHNLVTVGAMVCGKARRRTSFSNYSANHVDLFTSGDQVSVFEGFNCLRTVRGTSFACPIVTAKAAFHVTMQSRFNANDVLCKLRGESTPFPYAKYGIVDTNAPTQSCNKAGKDDYQGHPINSDDAIEEPTELTISPNPFNDRVTILTDETDALITIVDARGARVLRQETKQSSTTLELNNLKPGVYWVNVRSASGTQTRTIIKR